MSAAVNTHAHQMDYAYSLAQFSAAIEEHSHRH
jgi:hypothetical protein